MNLIEKSGGFLAGLAAVGIAAVVLVSLNKLQQNAAALKQENKTKQIIDISVLSETGNTTKTWEDVVIISFGSTWVTFKTENNEEVRVVGPHVVITKGR